MGMSTKTNMRMVTDIRTWMKMILMMIEKRDFLFPAF